MLRRAFSFGALGAALTYFFDPQTGKRRRTMARDRTLAFFRRTARKGAQAGKAVGAEAYGVAQKATHMKEAEKPQPNDATLKAKVESEIFRDAGVPKGSVDVNAENGIVILRGEVDRPELIEELESKTRDVQGVRDVENLLHMPGEPAPMHGAHSEH
jgi:hypothetical protein